MRTFLTAALAALLCLACPAGDFKALAQTGHRVRFYAPFDFTIRGARLRAGSYTVERLGQGNPAALVIKSAGGRERLVFFTDGVGATGAPRGSSVGFGRCGDESFLLEIRWAGEPTGRRIPPGDRERRACAGGRAQVFVRLTRE
jgi:hypothetical protein